MPKFVAFKTTHVSGLHFQQSKASARNEKQKAFKTVLISCATDSLKAREVVR